MKKAIILILPLLALSACGTTTGQRAGTGAVLGGATGAIIGNQSGRSWEGAAIGTAVGAIGGLAYDSAQKEKENDARYRAQREQYIYDAEYNRASGNSRPGPRHY